MSAKNQEQSFQTDRNGRRSKYQKISGALREEIIDRLVVKKEGLREVAAKLRINHSTCKAIVKVFENEGRIGKKKTRNRNVNVINTFTFCVVDHGMLVDLPQATVSEKRVTCNRSDNIDGMLVDQAKEEGVELAQEMLAERSRRQSILAAQTQPFQQNFTSRIFTYHPMQMNIVPQPLTLGICPQFLHYNPSNM